MTLKATVSMGWVNTVLASAQRLGVSPDALLAATGIPPDTLRRERWPIDHITRLWHAAERCTRNRGFGLKTGAGVTPDSLHELGLALRSSATLRSAIVMLQKYQQLISDGGRFQMVAGDASTWLVYHPRQGRMAFSPHQIEAVLAAVITLTGWIRGRPPWPRRVQFSESRLGPWQGYADVFACPVDFEQAFSGMLLDNAILDHPLPQADARVARLHEHQAATRLAALDAGDVSVVGLRQWLLANIGPQVPRRSQAAHALCTSERTLCRRLHEQGHSFDGLLDEVRRDLALDAVADPARDLSDIAQSLGFAEASTFYRAFQRWTRSPPARWRQQMQASMPLHGERPG